MDIEDSECADGENFDLRLGNSIFRRRAPFDLAGTATNGEAVNGYAQLLSSEGVLTTLIQAGTTVYLWDGGATFTEVGTVRAGARLRGGRAANWLLDDIALIADLGGVQPVLQWDGTALTEVDHNLSGDFIARYINVENERAIFANVKAGAVATPHVLVGSERGDYTSLSVTNRPSSALAVSDPWFIPVPDLKPINGLVSAFGLVAMSTDRGRVYKLTGANAKDFAIDELFSDSFASGDEPMTFAGNDVVFGRPGRIESLFSTDTLGDVDTDDFSREIANLIDGVKSWDLTYNSRLKRIFCYPEGGNDVWVLNKSLSDERVKAISQRREAPKASPWSRYTTQHSNSLQPSSAWSMLRPSDGIEHSYFGGLNGEIFQWDGAGAQDGGNSNIKAERLSKVFQAPVGGASFDVTGWVLYRKIFPATLTLTFEYGGEAIFDQEITIALEQAGNLPVYNGGFYYNNDTYYSAQFKTRLTRQQFSPAGNASHFQVRATVDGATDFFIQEIGITFEATTPAL